MRKERCSTTVMAWHGAIQRFNLCSFRVQLTFEPVHRRSLTEGRFVSQWELQSLHEVQLCSIQWVERPLLPDQQVGNSPEEDKSFYERLLACCFHLIVEFKHTSDSIIQQKPTRDSFTTAYLVDATNLAQLISTLQCCTPLWALLQSTSCLSLPINFL